MQLVQKIILKASQQGMLLVLVFISISYGSVTAAPIATWNEDFESYKVGELPSALWKSSGSKSAEIANSNILDGNAIHLSRAKNHCKAAVAHTAIPLSVPLDISFDIAIDNQKDSRTKCDFPRARVKLATSPTWKSRDRELIEFGVDGSLWGGDIKSKGKLSLGSYQKGNIYRIRVQYEPQSESTGVTRYWVNNNYIGARCFSSSSHEQHLKFLELVSFARGTWFDNIKISSYNIEENLKLIPKTDAVPRNFLSKRQRILKEALPYSMLSSEIYNCSKKCTSYCISGEIWEVTPRGLGSKKSRRSGFHAKAFKNNLTGKIAIVFEGTKSPVDWITNFSIPVEPEQYQHAYEYTQEVILWCDSQPSCSRDDIVLAGHSLGGGLAQYAAVRHALPAYVFNSAGLWKGTAQKIDINTASIDKIVSVVSSHSYWGRDLVSKTGIQFSLPKNRVEVEIPFPQHYRDPPWMRLHNMSRLSKAISREVEHYNGD